MSDKEFGVGPKLVPKGFQFWPVTENKLFTSVDDIVEAYEVKKFAGAFEMPEEKALLLQENKLITGFGSIEEAATANNWADSGAGKLVIPFVHVMEAYPGCWPGPPQEVGDCFPADTKVRMADGTEMDIDKVVIGDRVASPFGGVRIVRNVIKKPYTGDLISFKADGYARRVSSTPDHRFVSPTGVDGFLWTESEYLTERDMVLLSPTRLPAVEHVFDMAQLEGCMAVGRNDQWGCQRIKAPREGMVRAKASTAGEVYRAVTLDKDLAWFIGLFLAEGSIDKSKAKVPRRVTFNLCSDEMDFAKKVVDIAREKLGLEGSICGVPSKPSVLYVRFSSVPLARWLYGLVDGKNTYGKRVPSCIFTSSDDVKMGLVRGWLDGDGCTTVGLRKGSNTNAQCQSIGVSVSHGMAVDMFDIMASLKLRPTLVERKSRGRSKVAYNVTLYSDDVCKVYPEYAELLKSLKKQSKSSARAVLTHGIGSRVKDVERTAFSGDVYCLDVGSDHAFIANGYAVHNCVSHSSKNAALGTMVCEVAGEVQDEISGKLEEYPEVSPDGIKNGVISSEAIYWYRRSNSHGWYCGAACRVMQNESGIWLRQNYADLGFDLTRYSGKQTERYGAKPPTGQVAAAGKLHLVRAFAEAKSPEARRDALANGYFGNTCGSESYGRVRDANGVSKQTPEGWAHAMASIGYDDRPDTIQLYGAPLELILNSWSVWNSGPRDIRDSAKYVPPAKRDLWIRCDIVNPETGNIMIPKGAFWTSVKYTKNRDWLALSSVNGFPRRKLPDWGGSLAG